jgi:hypothetical protein
MQASSKVAIGVGVVGAVGVAVYFFGRKLLDALSNFNKGTPYEGTGAIGALGNATNQALGGAPAAVGSSIGLGLYDIFHPDEDEGPDTYYSVIFPDGIKHAVSARAISPDGVFQLSALAPNVQKAYGDPTTLFQIREKDGKRYATTL